jgi:MFS family permease
MAADEGKPRARLPHYLRVATLLMVAGLMFGLIGSATESLLPIYGLAKGLDEKSAAFLLALFAIGAVFGQLPAGWLADHFEHRGLLVAASLSTAIALLLMPALIETRFLIAPVMLVMGASLGSFYIVAMTMMGRRYRGADLIGVNTSFVFLWGVGAALGPGLSGTAMTVFGPDGMPALGVLLCVAFFLMFLRPARSSKLGA